MTDESSGPVDLPAPLVVRRLSDPKSMVGASSAQVRAMIPEGWYVIPFPDGRPGFQALDPGKLPGAFGTIGVHLRGNPLMRILTGADEPALFVLNECWELPSLGTVVRGRSSEPDGSYSFDLAGETAQAALLLLANKLICVWEVELLTGDARLLKPRAANEALLLVKNWKRDELDLNSESTTCVYFLDFTKPGRKAIEQIESKPIRLKYGG